MKKEISILTTIFLLLLCDAAAGQTVFSRSLGVVQSTKKIGLVYDYGFDENSYMSFCLAADMDGVWTEVRKVPGITASYYNNFILGSFKGEEGEDAYVYFGFGLNGGYVADGTRSHGLMAGAGVNLGLASIFRERLVVSLEWSAIAGMHLYNNIVLRKWYSSRYRSGYRYAWSPELRIAYLF